MYAPLLIWHAVTHDLRSVILQVLAERPSIADDTSQLPESVLDVLVS